MTGLTHMAKEAPTDRRFATTLARGMSVLRAFRPSDDGLSNQELSERTGLPKSTVSRLTFTLQALGYLSHGHRHDRYRPGPALLALGNVAAASVSFVDTATDIMQPLADETGTLVLIGVRDDQKILLTKTWRPHQASSIWLEVGHRIPLTHSSSGQAQLAAQSDREFASYVDTYGEMVEDSDVTVASLREDAYSQLVARGFVIAGHGLRYASTVNAVSVPFRSHEFDEPVVFTCGATPEMLTVERMETEVGPKLQAAVRTLERMTGKSPALVQRG
ncbi:IclR family transcriptional regulator [Pseudophaeobacter sp. 1A16562]|uniref:IclR family transcriptional regulator n=1 Tax=Rhodobacterales TaxID=204455 RepID=UPI00237EF3F3|nr:IclR family transcriptional regulator [Phaeobacter gallaeciensis]MDE4097017.1 IclR family transcriptional regulator [Phaeobacter gallaeciensis]MDE4105689.1 IclR family transcriptional regulator [Phaeobacter gallaeciensis]MDE4110284.1 IclR family transcriptional regulator [Phaeobacter gallaeciensis]MDE4114752.1 IclR family transcriptional regulator [Phaeobacter gallaeciensis]MDE4119081.1 IclR family transcriptional regulator [Phaeobacter gallaeciensis]